MSAVVNFCPIRPKWLIPIVYILWKKYLEEYTPTRKTNKKKAEKFVVNDGESFYLLRKDKQVNWIGNRKVALFKLLKLL